MKLHLWTVTLGEGRVEYYKKPKWRGKDSQSPMIISRANIRPDLIFWIIEHYLNVLCVVLDINMWLRISPFPETTPENQEHMSASSDCMELVKGQESRGVTGRVRLAVPNCSICTLMVLSAVFLLRNSYSWSTGCMYKVMTVLLQLFKLLRATCTFEKNSICRDHTITLVEWICISRIAC